MEKIKVGNIINTHGIKGEIKVLRTGVETFDRDIQYLIEDIKVEIQNVRTHKNTYILKLKSYDNINDVLSFKSKSIFINKSDLLNHKDEYYHIDLIGLEVYEGEKKIGTLNDILSYEVNDVYVVKTADGEILIPAVDEFILNIDLENNRIDVKLIEGM